eukprot:CAMPEP_0117081432 /NCGR_PEP_ID=MMETSP0472-20121206/57391_1 /TAXON_ID=693140 ORGANISM="Tiarina fusus, Strain LIS" /NCGR_SAMPLE_ID=MMETSP0472 /ASSEMBLY_ACC=CAM_ASM_000603 /LENGTH=432 /DNA_ID=CAMNT_0004809353 /DNA_START=217 /DNA_END=1515 /DNA_ORIENTATION=+
MTMMMLSRRTLTRSRQLLFSQKQQQQQQQQQQQVLQRRTKSSATSQRRTKSCSTTASPNLASFEASSTSSSLSSSLSSFHSTTWHSLVHSPQIRAALPLIGNGAYLAIVSGFLMTDMLQLRMALVGGYTGLVAFHSLHPRPLQIPLRWSAVFIVVNAVAATVLAMDRWGTALSEEESVLYEQHFSSALTKGQFSQLLQLATKECVQDETILTTEGQVCPNLYFLLEGQAKVYHNMTYAANIDQGGFVNDIAFQQKQQQQQQNQQQEDNTNVISSSHQQQQQQQHQQLGAYGTVVANGDCQVLTWNASELRRFLKSKPEMEKNLKHTLSEQLMKSLLKQREARHEQTSSSLSSSSSSSSTAMAMATSSSRLTTSKQHTNHQDNENDNDNVGTIHNNNNSNDDHDDKASLLLRRAITNRRLVNVEKLELKQQVE